MGMSAQVIAIGPFAAEIAACLEYGEHAYADVQPGTIVISNVFGEFTTTGSRALAAAFGVGALEMGRHVLDPAAANIAQLTEQCGEEEVDNFQRLARAGFRFYYLPNA